MSGKEAVRGVAGGGAAAAAAKLKQNIQSIATRLFKTTHQVRALVPRNQVNLVPFLVQKVVSVKSMGYSK